jgi:GH15 family glucan-1,4-alpha-glucosidase
MMGCRPARAHFSPVVSGMSTISYCSDGATRRALFEHLLSLRNDVGLLAEEYDPRAKRQLGNFPQAFSHVALITSAYNLTQREAEKPAKQRSTAS